MEEQKNGYLKMRHFQWIVGLILVIICSVFSFVFSSIGKVEGQININREKVNEVAGDIKSIKTSLDFIIDNLIK